MSAGPVHLAEQSGFQASAVFGFGGKLVQFVRYMGRVSCYLANNYELWTLCGSGSDPGVGGLRCQTAAPACLGGDRGLDLPGMCHRISLGVHQAPAQHWPNDWWKH